MKKTPIAMALAALVASSAAIAAEGDFVAADTNVDGVLSLDEVLVMHPDATEETFISADVNGDGVLSEEEYNAATGAAVTTQ
ncbi:MAG: EF-hand domain-containing protein [Pseudomonadota bacterium]